MLGFGRKAKQRKIDDAREMARVRLKLAKFDHRVERSFTERLNKLDTIEEIDDLVYEITDYKLELERCKHSRDDLYGGVKIKSCEEFYKTLEVAKKELKSDKENPWFYAEQFGNVINICIDKCLNSLSNSEKYPFNNFYFYVLVEADKKKYWIDALDQLRSEKGYSYTIDERDSAVTGIVIRSWSRDDRVNMADVYTDEVLDLSK